MEYVEMLRARRVLTWYGGLLLVLTGLCFALGVKSGPPQIHIGMSGPAIPIHSILSGAAFGAVLLAAFLAVGLDAEYKTTAITWTRPLSRVAIALRFLAVDFGTFIAAWLLTVLLVVVAIVALGLGKYLTFGGFSGTYIALMFGCAVMWYGLVVLLTALLPGRGSAITGMSWAYVLVTPALTQIPFPPLLHNVTVGLVYLNPLVYIGINAREIGVLYGSPGLNAAMAWGIGLVAVAGGIRLWSAREVPS
jgi:hypothetical protein